MTTSTFGGHLDLKLLAFVKDNPMLYNSSHAKYSDTDTRELVWQKIGDALQKPARHCKMRWANIRDNFRKKLRDRVRYREQQHKSYRYEEELSFILPFFKDGKHALSNYIEENTEAEDIDETVNQEDDGEEKQQNNNFDLHLDLKLIEHVKENPVMYNSMHPKYCDNNMRELIWQKIGDDLQMPARKCKSRWSNIRDMMRKKLKERLRHPDQQLKNYRYEEELAFMIPYFKDSSNDNYSDFYDDATEVEMPSAVFLEGDFNQDDDDEDVKPILTFRKRKREPTLACDSEPPCQDLNTSDPIDIFLMTIGSTIRKFSPYYLNQAKSKIFQIVQEYELKQIVKDKETADSI